MKLFINPWEEVMRVLVGGKIFSIYKKEKDRPGCSFIEFYESLQKFSWTPFESRREIDEFCQEGSERLSKDSTFFLFEEDGINKIGRVTKGDEGFLYLKSYSLNSPCFFKGDNTIVVKLMPR